jgi:hypothetical protein
MRVLVLLGFVAATLPYYGHAADPPAAPAPQTQPDARSTTTVTTAPTAAAIAPENVRTITIDPTVRRPVCKRFVPTGSRIAEQRCETPQTAAQADANREVLRRDFQAMRDQQMLREQARQAAAARRRVQ